jgi:hypothetical protein
MGLFDGVEGKGKTEPNAEMREVAVTIWQMYTALKDAGFSKTDAMGMVRDTMTAMVTSSVAAAATEEESKEGE